MTVIPITDANPCQAFEWKLINWEAIKRSVRKLQARIVKALQQRNRRKVKDLRRLLVHSRAARLLAVLRVTTNRGKKTPGVDGEIWSTLGQKLKAYESLKQPSKPSPLRRVYIPKKNGKKRPLGIPTMHDRAQQALHLLALEPIAETSADVRSYGFRPARGCADAINYCYRALRSVTSAQWVLEGDIRSCFDEINHQWLLQHIPMDKLTLHRWLKAGFVEKGRLFPSLSGAPQGGIVSPALANMTLDGLEALLHKNFGQPGSKSAKHNRVYYCRYADDFIITGSSKELLEKEVKPLVTQFMRERGLQLSEEKTLITQIATGFDFLGQNLRKYNGKLLIKPSMKSFQTVKTKLKGMVAKHWNRQEIMIRRINSIIIGWCNYHRHIVSSHIFSKLDNYMFQILWQHAKRAHPQKNRRWIAKRHFHSVGLKRWVFGHKIGGQFQTVKGAQSIHIYRHTAIKGEVNPFDPKWKMYLEKRWTRNCRRKEPKFLEKLLNRVESCCHFCSNKISDKDSVIVHFPNDNITLDKDPRFKKCVLVHEECYSRKVASRLSL